MLNNIKMLLAITDTSKDNIINYWIDYYSKMVLKYCHADTLNTDLESIIEQMVITKMGGIGSGGAASTAQQDTSNGIKSITRGDYSVTYKDNPHDKTQSFVLDPIAMSFQGQLNLWRRLDY